MDKFVERKCDDTCEYKLMVRSLSKSLAKYHQSGVTPEEINIREEEIQRLLCEVRELKKQLIREQQKVGADMKDNVDRCIKKVKCIEKQCENLTYEKEYEVIKQWREMDILKPYDVYLIIDDTGNKCVEPCNLFKEVKVSVMFNVDRCIMCGEPIPEGVQVCYACRTRSKAIVSKIGLSDKQVEELQEENENLKEEIKYTETLLECWKGCAIEMMDRFGKVMSKRK